MVRRWPALALTIAAAACGGERAVEPGPDAPRTGDAVEVPATAPVASAPAGLLDEASARLLIAGLLRATGLRVVADVPLGDGGVEVTLDGFDPARRVGYEYIAADERGADLDDAERERLAGMAGTRVLVIESGDAEAVTGAVERFLAAGADGSTGSENTDSAGNTDAQRDRPPGPSGS